MKTSVSPHDLIDQIILKESQFEYKEKDGEHYAGPIREIRMDGEFLVVDLLWRADYVHTEDKWFGARENPHFKTRGYLIRIVRSGNEFLCESPDERVQIIFHSPSSPCVRQSDVEGLEIRSPVATQVAE